MSERSAIEWTDSTFNPWIGCTKVGPGCDHCYAEALMDTRYGKVKWGAGQPRVRTSAANWRKPVKWNNEPFYECRACGARGEALFMIGEHNKCCPKREVVPARRRVFCASLADVFDNEVDPAWRDDLMGLIWNTPNLDWLVLTKRIGNVQRMLDELSGRPLQAGERMMLPSNVWLGATMVNRDEMLRDAEKLKAIRAHVLFWSVEPMLGDLGPIPPELLPHWVIVGGESGHHARPMHPDWARSLRDQCVAAGVPFLFKQWGEWAPYDRGRINLPSGALDDPMQKFGKKLAGRHLDGTEHNGFPEAA